MSSHLTRLIAALSLVLALTTPAVPQGLTALARLEGGASGAASEGDALVVTLSLTQAVPYRVFTLDAPRRLVMDFREVDWRGIDRAAFLSSDRIIGLNAGTYRPGWSRLVLELDAPLAVAEAGMVTDPAAGSANISIRLEPVDEVQFSTTSGAPDAALWGLPEIAEVATPIRRQTGDRPVKVVLDPGHGGIDPGAEHGALNEAELMLIFARELKEALIRAGFEVVLTRDDDSFVPLETRVSIARAARADVFLSLHADALSEGQATGATVYTLSDTASDRASALLAERHDRADLLAGVDLSNQDDVIAGVLMDLARLETEPRSDHLADALVDGLRTGGTRMYKRPRLTAGFSVLKAPDIPSVLIELGFLSSPRDLANLQSKDWRATAAGGIVAALRNWAASDAAEAELIRQ